MSIKETIDANIDDLRERIEMQAKTVKTLLREALACTRLPPQVTTSGSLASLNQTRMHPQDFQKMDDEISDNRRVVD